ncbi:ABC1 kinase family protein [Phytoactinopolyspora endophytica]|uniref:ABC1 kinase family protein n=1 Tax=Phytoactinopolyspora endophytica TaxID=1642495 RepID=UPI00101D9D3A|nr:AarF/UbiB family protein [Phytoactinopolyspora endophytica]
MHVLALPTVLIFGFVMSLIVGMAAQRLLGIRLGVVRLILAGAFALFVGPFIMIAILGPVAPDAQDPDPEIDFDGTTFWFLLLSLVCIVLASMAFIVVVEAFAPLGSIPPARIWGRGLRGRFKRARRYWQIIGIAVRNGLGPYIRGGRRRALAVPSGRAQLGRALTATLNRGGVTFVKMGQIMATRRDMLPVEMVTELASLQDDAEPVPWEDVERVLLSELGSPAREIFADIDPTPLAAASVGQVHVARLHSGEEVVVKVQRPGIRPVVERDLDIAARLAARLENGTDWARGMGLSTLAEGLAAAIREELDYRVEADNIVAIAEAHPAGSDVRLPGVHAQLCTERVLVMERLRGTPLNAAGPAIDQNGLSRTRIARSLLSVLFHQIIDAGVFHADPHGGNILVLDDGRLGLLDFGSVGRLDGSLREALQRLLLGVDHGDPLAVSDALLELVPRPDEIDEQRLERDLGRFLARHVSGSGSPSARMFGDLFRIVADHGLSIPPEVAAVFRTLATAEGTLSAVAPSFNLISETRSLASGYMTEQLAPDQLKQSATEELARLVPVLRRLPRRVERIANAAEHGRLGLNVRFLADERDRAVITGLLHEILVAFIAATTGIMAVILLGMGGGPEITEDVSLHELIGYNLLVISAILALRVLVRIFRRS